jgi:alpha/beta superfamily hydrolase
MTESRGLAGLPEQPCFFSIGTERIFAMAHEPRGERRRVAVVFCHALAEEKLWSHRVYVNFAREAAARGIFVLRPDFRGEGESDRDFEATNVATRVEDVRRCVEEARSRAPHAESVILVGHRFGASIAAAAAQSGVPVAGLVAWDPLPDGREYFMQMLRSNLTTQIATQGKVTRDREKLVEEITAGRPVGVDGYAITKELFEQAVALDWFGNWRALPQGALFVELSKAGSTEPSAPVKALMAKDGSLEAAVVEEQPYFRETKQFHQRAANTFASTLSWLERRS